MDARSRLRQAKTEHRLACFKASHYVEWTSSEEYAMIPKRGEAHPSEETTT